MKKVKGPNGEIELQPPEYVPVGPVDIRSLERRLKALEEQVRLLQNPARIYGPTVKYACRSGCECLRCGGHRKP